MAETEEKGNAPSRVRCVIYDCDGVLFDSLEANNRLYSDICESLGRPPLTEEELHFIHMHTVFEAVRYITRNEPHLEPVALERLKQTDLRRYVAYLKMEPHLLETLERLGRAKIIRAIDTNRTTSMPHVLDLFNLRPYFDMVVTALDVTHPKPHPESVLKILENFSLDKEEALFVGDSEVDQQTARGAGIRFIAYKNPSLASDGLIEDHLEILKFLC